MATQTNLQKMNIESCGVMQFLRNDAVNGFPNGNFVSSPALIDAGLSIVAEGSEGETLKQLLDFLVVETLDDLHLNSSSLKVLGLPNNGLSVTSRENYEGPRLYFGNAVWVDKHFPLLPSFQEVLRKIYGAEVNSVDFQNQVDVVIKDANSWVKNATNGLINEILSSQAISHDTMLILTSALYFKAAWARGFQFNPIFTTNHDFYLLNGKSKSVPFMTLLFKYYEYGYFDDCSVLKIPYQEGGDSTHFSMYFFLPHEKNGLPSLIEKFHGNPEVFNQCLSLSRERIFKLRIPKFKVSFDLDVSDTLMKNGLVRPFELSGELTGMVHLPHGKRICVQKIVVKCCIEVDEVGTEAAASLAICGGGTGPPPFPDFIADHPFMFIIREEISGAVLFVGSILNP